MIVYKVADQLNDDDINANLRAVVTQLAAIGPTLQNLESIIAKHEDTVSSPSIAGFRNNLKQMARDAAILTQQISQNSLVLIEVGEQAGKHLASLEEHYSTIFRDRTPVQYLDQQSPVAEHTQDTPVLSR